jgi:hypothetical protein
MAMRADIESAFNALDRKAQRLMTKTPLVGPDPNRQFTQTLQRLPDFFRDERVVALAPAKDPTSTLSQTGLDLGAAMGAGLSEWRSQRLLVLTETSLWEVTVSGRLSGGQPQGVEVPLGATV